MNDTRLTKPMLDDYAEDAVPGWKYIDRGHHVFANPNYGQLEVGKVPGESWDQWLFHENGGGGSLVIGYRFNDLSNKLEIMMLKAARFNLIGDSDDYELPGGFVDGDETKLITAIREGLEETGQLSNPEPVSGRGFVGNRAFFQLNGEHEGTSVFMFELTDEQVEAIGTSDKLEMMPWQDAVRATRDALSGMAIARFVAETL